eukprot:CAMPEP_0178995768 /NCGR_PEP_ID=MMETSP0795-20121207/7993_1 /TAXON_ID=88552 /ORGANISM="Amoebophrya sp., Strain Ameob2" /LENGTH=294 /DNA_ID=CAMNT_0020688077 /DNA_START=64 /DNA_END=948 /DNA_ORIENTATION=+
MGHRNEKLRFFVVLLRSHGVLCTDSAADEESSSEFFGINELPLRRTSGATANLRATARLTQSRLLTSSQIYERGDVEVDVQHEDGSPAATAFSAASALELAEHESQYETEHEAEGLEEKPCKETGSAGGQVVHLLHYCFGADDDSSSTPTAAAKPTGGTQVKPNKAAKPKQSASSSFLEQEEERAGSTISDAHRDKLMAALSQPMTVSPEIDKQIADAEAGRPRKPSSTKKPAAKKATATTAPPPKGDTISMEAYAKAYADTCLIHQSFANVGLAAVILSVLSIFAVPIVCIVK